MTSFEDFIVDCPDAGKVTVRVTYASEALQIVSARSNNVEIGHELTWADLAAVSRALSALETSTI